MAWASFYIYFSPLSFDDVCGGGKKIVIVHSSFISFLGVRYKFFQVYQNFVTTSLLFVFLYLILFDHTKNKMNDIDRI